MKNKELIRTIKFVLFSASAGLIEIGTFTLLTAVTNWAYWPRYLIALVLSVIWNFTLNRSFTFNFSILYIIIFPIKFFINRIYFIFISFYFT